MSGIEHASVDARGEPQPAVAIVTIVLSAGGLTPLRTLMEGLSPSSAAAFVIAQHVHHVTLLPAILSRHTEMPVGFAESGALLQPGRVYVCPAAQHVIVNPDATLTLSGRGRLRRFQPNGDWLFESAAASFHEHTFAIVLSGVLNDGACGTVAVRRAGGTVIVQRPDTCEHADMPSAAIALGTVDHVLAAEQMSEFLNGALAALDVPSSQSLRDNPFEPIADASSAPEPRGWLAALTLGNRLALQ
jgi:two-component system chemotaxis response regulator CheB